MAKFARSAVVAMFTAMGVASATKWNDERIGTKVKNLPKFLEDEDNGVDTDKLADEHKKTLKKLLKAVSNDDEIELADDAEAAPAAEAPAKEEKPAKKEKAAAKSDDDGDDDEDEKPAKKDKADSDKPKKGPPKKAGDGTGPGVIGSIVEFLYGASEEKPLTKKDLVEKLAKRFPDREAAAMAKTVNVQVPNRIKTDKGITVNKNDKGYWAVKPKEEKSSSKEETKPAKAKKEADEDDDD